MTAIKRRRALAAGVVVLVGVMATACSSPPERATPDLADPMTVTVATIEISDLADSFEAGGVVEARNTATVTARILAPVSEVRVAPGDRVRAGQLLVVLEGSSLEAQSRGARAQVRAASQGATAAAAEERAAQASLALARATHERIAALSARKSATPQELDTATAALRSAEARLAGASARVQEAASGLEAAEASSQAADAAESYSRITAPFTGMVTEKMVEPGNMAAPGTPLLRVEDTGEFRLEIRVDESRSGQITTGAVVSVLLGGDGSASREVMGVVSEISRAVDADTRAFLVKITLLEAVGLRSGIFGRARFDGARRQALVVPPEAVVRQGQVTSVFVVSDGVAHLRLVRVRDSEVLAGLSAGETVVLSPPPGLADGRRVTAEVRR